MEESILDYCAGESYELMEAFTKIPITDRDKRDPLIMDHISKMHRESTSVVLDPDEKADWVSGPADDSLASYCAGSVALLDFFTYCCINCQHVLPDLHDLEKLYSVNDGLTVVGIHSAKFDAERLPANVLHAIQRLNIGHPVLNDPDARLWNRIGIQCWPTLVLLNPEGKPILVLPGEGHREILFRAVEIALSFYKEKKMLKIDGNKITVPSSTDKINTNSLRFPGKVTFNPFISNGSFDEPWLTISDSGHNRIIITDRSYKVVHIIGGIDIGLKNGEFSEARFNSPQGGCWLDKNTFVVCDTGNHVLRRINIETKTVETLAGSGVQAEFGDKGGLKYCQQPLASPWDVILYKTSDMDMSIKKLVVPPDDQTSGGADSESQRRVLLIACAGSHQIWALFLDTTVWWKYKTYAEGTLVPIVGSGKEENRNHRYPDAAGLAQPSGLALNGEILFIADSESSSIRNLDMKVGQVVHLAGADRNPCNLFSYGDVDGRGYMSKLQHPLGVSFCFHMDRLMVADTYNHKIKTIELSNSECTTFYPTSNSNETLSEPGGLCVVEERKSVMIADTNNHRLLSIDLDTKLCTPIALQFVDAVKPKTENHSKKNLCAEKLFIHPENGKITLTINCRAKQGGNMHFTPNAPQRWDVKIFNDDDMKNDLIDEWDLSGDIRSGKDLPGKFVARRKVGHSLKEGDRCIVRVELFLSFCEEGLCFMRSCMVDYELIASTDAKKSQSYALNLNVSSDKKKLETNISCQDD